MTQPSTQDLPQTAAPPDHPLPDESAEAVRDLGEAQYLRLKNAPKAAPSNGPTTPQNGAPVLPHSAVPPRYRMAAEPNQNVSAQEFGAGLLLLVLWIGFFAAGTFISTRAYRDALLQGVDFWTGVGYTVAVFFCYAVTNILFLSCLSSMLGCMMARWNVSGDGREAPGPSIPASRLYLAAFLRGFFLYLLVISGLLVLSTEEAVVNSQLGQYIRIAGLVSVFGFVVGYDPNILYRWIGRVSEFANAPLQVKTRQTQVQHTDAEGERTEASTSSAELSVPRR